MPLAAPGSLDIGRRIRTFWYGCRTYPIALLILLCGTGISLLAGNWYEREEYLRLEQEFLRTTESQLHNIEHTLQHNGEVIKQLGLIYELSLEFRPSSFQHYLRGLSDFEHRFKAVEWIPRVTHEQRASFELEAQAFYPGYRITERMEQGAMVAAKPRPEYFPVYLVEPLAGNEAALGFDLASQATRKRALQKSAESGEFSVSGRITLGPSTRAIELRSVWSRGPWWPPSRAPSTSLSTL